MKTNFTKIITAIMIVAMLGSCASSKKTASSGYNANQTKPATVEQASAANRGLKLQKEECEAMALAATDNLRESGNGISDSESFAVNIALLDARSKLAQQIEVLISGMIRTFNQQHQAGQASSSVSKSSQIQQGYFDQFLTNTRPICQNTYVKEDGKYNVYVCLEMNVQQQKAMHKKLSEDKKIAIDFEESQFLKELSKAKEDFRQQQLGK